jgi:hypothetical protein
MNGANPRFWAGPLRYWRWAARERPGLFWAVVIGSIGPLTLATVPPIRRAIGDPDAAPIPLTYPGMFPSFFLLCIIVCLVWWGREMGEGRCWFGLGFEV